MVLDDNGDGLVVDVCVFSGAWHGKVWHGITNSCLLWYDLAYPILSNKEEREQRQMALS